jgi:D-galactonate transporter
MPMRLDSRRSRTRREMSQAIHDVRGDVSADERSTYARVTWRLLPLLFICYVIAYLDRVNVGFAKLQMLHDLHFSEAVYGLGAGIFFVGYCCFEVPANVMLSRLGARRWMTWIMVCWGIVSACTMFVRTPVSFYILRCLLGVSESGMFPGVIFYLTLWYPSHRRGRVVAMFMTAQPVSGVIGGPVSGWILQEFHEVGHLAGWQWLFLLEGLPAVVMGVVLFYWIENNIRDARWLSEVQKRMLEEHIAADSALKEKHHGIGSIIRDGRVWLLSAVSFCSVIGMYGIVFWLPTIIKATGVERPLQVGLLTMIPYGAAAVVMNLAGRSSDRSGERRWHLALSTIASGLGLIFATMHAGNTTLALVGLTVAAAGGFTSQPLFWNLPTGVLGGTAAAAGIALINAVGNSGGFVGPYLVGWISDATHGTSVGIYALAFSLFLGSALTFLVPAALVNRRRE